MLSAFIPLFLLFPTGTSPPVDGDAVGVLTFAAPVFTTIGFAVTPGELDGRHADIGSAHVIEPARHRRPRRPRSMR